MFYTQTILSIHITIHSYHLYIHHNLSAWTIYIWISSPYRASFLHMYHSRNTWIILSTHESSSLDRNYHLWTKSIFWTHGQFSLYIYYILWTWTVKYIGISFSIHGSSSLHWNLHRNSLTILTLRGPSFAWHFGWIEVRTWKFFMLHICVNENALLKADVGAPYMGKWRFTLESWSCRPLCE